MRDARGVQPVAQRKGRGVMFVFDGRNRLLIRETSILSEAAPEPCIWLAQSALSGVEGCGNLRPALFKAQ